MYMNRQRIDLEKADGATATFYSDLALSGLVHMVSYSTASSALPSTAAITVEGEVSGVDMLTSAAVSAATKAWFPRELAVETSGASTAAIYPEEPFPVANERIKVSLAGCTSAFVSGGAYLDLWVLGGS
jgi:hypothetical protein